MIRYYVAIAVAAGSLGVAVGRYLTPPKVVTKTEVVTKEVVRTVTVETKAKARDVVRYVKVTEQPGGTKTTETSEHEHEAEHVVAEEKRTDDTSSHIVTSKVVSAPKSWMIGPMVGVGGLGAAGGLSPVVGAQVMGRVWGPVHLGAWGLYATKTKQGSAGLGVAVEF